MISPSWEVLLFFRFGIAVKKAPADKAGAFFGFQLLG
jgi:hypothetical protein